ncbi:MAG: GntR family transcriptional regulator [Alphaproteobacteria bacterium]|nr:MAG: GntR family transcriptional regulator [Alphaproteobacteria bacterium]
MQITIDIDAEEPLFAQLMGGIKAAVSAGTLAPGAPLPSIRQLANDLDLNNKTVAKAYQLLERDNIIQTKGYRGTFVHPDAKAHVDFDLNAWVAGQISDTVEACRARGATDSEIRIAFANLMQNKMNGGQ